MMSAGRLPPYGRQLLEKRRAGLVPNWLCIALDWRLGHAWPRAVLPPGTDPRKFDLSFARGCDCVIAARPEDKPRVGAVFDQLVKFGARDIRLFVVDEGLVEYKTLLNRYGVHTDRLEAILDGESHAA